MKRPAWQRKNYSLSSLRGKQRVGHHKESVFAWLKEIGVVPADVAKVWQSNVRPNLDPERIDGHYLASSAFEWDTWGPSSPKDFLDALELETAGCTRRDFVADTLYMLGQIGQEEPTAIEYRVAL